jgi:hypothetical protein
MQIVNVPFVKCIIFLAVPKCESISFALKSTWAIIHKAGLHSTIHCKKNYFFDTVYTVGIYCTVLYLVLLFKTLFLLRINTNALQYNEQNCFNVTLTTIGPTITYAIDIFTLCKRAYAAIHIIGLLSYNYSCTETGFAAA